MCLSEMSFLINEMKRFCIRFVISAKWQKVYHTNVS